MTLIYFFDGLAFGGLGLASYLQLRQGSDLPLWKNLKWLAAFGFACGLTSWIDMFLVSSGTDENLLGVLRIMGMIFRPITGLLLLRFGWGILREQPLPAWTIFIPGVLIVPLAYVITYALTTFVTPSPVEIPIDIWSRYLLYLPGSIMAGIGFMRLWHAQRKEGVLELANLMLGAGLAFLFEAFIAGLVIPAAPYAPGSYYNYNRVVFNAFSGESSNIPLFAGLSNLLDYQRILEITGLPIQFWRMLSSFAVTFFVVRGLGVFEARRRMQLASLKEERDRAQQNAFNAEIAARQTAERWTEVMVNINSRIMELNDMDATLTYITDNARQLLASDFIGLALINEDESRLELKCYSTKDSTALVEASVIVRAPLILETLKSARSYHSNGNELPESMVNVMYSPDTSARNVVIVCLEMDNRPIGALWAARASGQSYTDTDLVWLECMADQVVIALQHALMTSRLQSLSIIEERSRIAREMHDGLAQVLGYLNLQVQTLDALLKQGKKEDLTVELNQMRKAIKIANADVRENILSLRTTLANEKGLVPAIGEYLDEFGEQARVDAFFNNDVEEDLRLSSVAEVQLVCILQEALANVRKHARANRVNVLVTRRKDGEKEYIYLLIEDDGVGLLNYDSKRHFGLTTMKERAASVGGRLEVHSRTEKGTVVECWLPCLEPERTKRNQPIFSG